MQFLKTFTHQTYNLISFSKIGKYIIDFSETSQNEKSRKLPKMATLS